VDAQKKNLEEQQGVSRSFTLDSWGGARMMDELRQGKSPVKLRGLGADRKQGQKYLKGGPQNPMEA